jgi:hydroxymethylpyrimidine/phosphomethylpyrimidine kinase
VLATGEPLVNAVSAAKIWLERALEAADALDLGDGRGPPHHLHGLQKAPG